jgi:Tol biopolymer transport system component
MGAQVRSAPPCVSPLEIPGPMVNRNRLLRIFLTAQFCLAMLLALVGCQFPGSSGDLQNLMTPENLSTARAGQGTEAAVINQIVTQLAQGTDVVGNQATYAPGTAGTPPAILGTPTNTPTITLTPTATATFDEDLPVYFFPTATLRISLTPTATWYVIYRSPTASLTWIPTITRTPSRTPTRTRTVTRTPTQTATPTPSPSITVSGTATATLIETAVDTLTSTPTGTPTATVTESETAPVMATATTTATSTGTVTETPVDIPADTDTLTPTPTLTETSLPVDTPPPSDTETITPTATVPAPVGYLAVSIDTNGDGRRELVIMDNTGGDQHVVDVGKDTRLGGWSPDGQKLVYSADAGSGRQIFIVGADGSGDTQILNLPAGENSQPAWSPDGQWIAFVNVNDDGSGSQSSLYMIGVDGSNLTQLASDAGKNINSDPAWSKDGQTLFYVHSGDIYSIDVNPVGTPSQRVSFGNSGVNASLDVSPDGNMLIFARKESSNWDIWTAGTDGSNPQPDDAWNSRGNEQQPCWAGGNDAAVFISDQSGSSQLYYGNSDGVFPVNDSWSDPINPVWKP